MSTAKTTSGGASMSIDVAKSARATGPWADGVGACGRDGDGGGYQLEVAMAAQRRRMARGTVVVIGIALAAVTGSCGGGGRSLADQAEGTWSCDYHQTFASPGLPTSDEDATATARITPDGKSHGTFTVKLTGEQTAGRPISIDGDWTLAGHNLRVAIRHDAFGEGGTLEYRGVTGDTRTVMARGSKADPFRPVHVARHGSQVEFRWDPWDGAHARLTCRRP